MGENHKGGYGQTKRNVMTYKKKNEANTYLIMNPFWEVGKFNFIFKYVWLVLYKNKNQN